METRGRDVTRITQVSGRCDWEMETSSPPRTTDLGQGNGRVQFSRETES